MWGALCWAIGTISGNLLLPWDDQPQQATRRATSARMEHRARPVGRIELSGAYRGCINKLLGRQRVSKVQISERMFCFPMKLAAYLHEFIQA